MTQWTLSLWPTTIPASDPTNLQLNYQWSTYTTLPDSLPVSILPPVLAKDDTVLVLLYLSNGETPIAAGDISLSHEVTAPAGFPSGTGTELMSGTNQWPIFTVPAPVPPAEYQIFKFRITITFTPTQPGSSCVIYTVDPEVVVGDGQGHGSPQVTK